MASPYLWRPLTPNGTYAVGGWTVVGAASVSEAIRDASDTTYITPATVGTAIVFMGDPVFPTEFPALSQIRSLQLFARGHYISGTNPNDNRFSFVFASGYPGGAGQNVATVAMPNTGLATRTSPVLTVNPVTGLGWTADDFAWLNFHAYNAGWNGQLRDAWGEIVYNEAPVATVVAPTTPQATSRPTVGWTYSDPESDAQERYRVKVFTAAQYGAGGFDPETSAATWDSGEVLSAAGSVVVGTDLLDDVTYRAYVKVADVGSSGRYGPWAYIGFTVEVTPPPVPYLTVTTDPALARVKVHVDVGTFAAAAQIIVVERSDDGGVTWTTVRGAGALPAGSGAGLDVYDYEVPRQVAMRYRAKSTAIVSGNVLASAWTAEAGVQSVRLNGVAGTYVSTPDSPENSLAGNTVFRLSGVTGSYASTPDSVALTPTTEIDLRARVALDNWLLPTEQFVVMKYGSTNLTRVWGLMISTAGRIRVRFGAGDVAPTVGDSDSPSPTWINGKAYWVRVTWRASDGLASYYYSADDTNDSTAVVWDPEGTDIIPVAGLGPATGTPVSVGGGGTGASPLAGTIYVAEVRSRIDGPVVAKFDPSALTPASDQSPTTLVSTTSEIWTANGTRWNWRRDNEHRSLRLSGASGVYASCPDTAALSITGDIDLRAKVRMDDWTPATEMALISKYAANRSYMLSVDPGGQLRLRLTADGSTPVSATSSVVVGATDGSAKWVRATWVNSTDVVQFFTSDDGATWVQLGTNTSIVLTGIFDGVAPVEIGAYSGGTLFPLAGNVYAIEIRSGVDGTVVANPDFGNAPWDVGDTGAATGTDAAGNTWTLQGAAVIQRAFEANVDLRVKLLPDNWAPATDMNIAAKYGSAGNAAWFFRLSPTGFVRWAWYRDGVNGISVNSAVYAMTAGKAAWLRVTFQPNNGAGGRTTTFYKSTDYDPDTGAGIWTQISQSVVTGTTVIYDSSAAVALGLLGSSELMVGNIYYAELSRGIDGPVVVDFDAAEWETGDAAPTTRDGWTLQGAASIVGGVELATEGWWLKDPLAPALNMRFEAAPPFGFRRKEPQTVYEPLGSSDSVVVTDGVKGIEGTLEVRTRDAARYAKLEALIAAGRPLWLEDVLGRWWYIKFGAATDWTMIVAAPTVGETTPLRHLHEQSLPFAQVRRPAGELVAAGTPTG